METVKRYKTAKGTEIILVQGGRSNVFLVTDGNIYILVDSGPAFMRSRLIRNIEKLGITRIDYLVLTHAHFDHAANAAVIKTRFGARVIIHDCEADLLSLGDNPVIKGTNPFTKMLVRLLEKPLKEKLKYDPCKADILVKEKMSLGDSDIKADILPVPGHTPGSMSLIVDDELALVGDAVFGVFPNSVMPTFGGDKKEIVKSWERLLDTGCSWFFPSHGTPVNRALLEGKFIQME